MRLNHCRILGSGEFVENVLKEIERRELETLRLKQRGIQLEDLCREVAKAHDVEFSELTSGSRRRQVVKARADVALMAVKRLGLSCADVARFLGVSTSSVNYVVNKKEISSIAEKVRDGLDRVS